MTLPPGLRLGPYEILAPLGAGGMGEVYRARDPRLGRDVAVKVLPASFSNDPDRLRRFEQEAKAAGLLNHPNITAVYDAGSVDGSPYVVSELLDGETLRARLAGGALTVRKALDYARQIASGLAAAHEKGIVHRDLKPENLFVTQDGRVKILDFGLAKLTQPEQGAAQTNIPTATRGTEPGVVLGTMGYMSPEQVRGRPADARSDIFSFGSILYEMLSGKRAFQGESDADTMSAILREDPPELSSINRIIAPAIDRIVRHCLEKNPGERFHSAHDLAFDLEALSGISSTSTVAVPRPRARLSPLLVSAALAVLALTAAVLFLTLRAKPSAPPRMSFLTFSGSDSAPSVSPDGRLIAFVSSRDGRSRIWMKQLANGDEVALTSGEDGSPRFSPDGASLMFVRAAKEGPSLYRVSVVGGEPQKMIENAQWGDWSPDGSRVVYIRPRERAGRSVGSILAAASIDGSGERRIAEETELSLSSPRWSPDGKTIAAVRFGGSVSIPDQIVLFESETGKSRALPSSKDGGVISSFAWTADGGRFLYAQSSEVTGFVHLSRIVLQEVRSAALQTLLWVPNIVSSLDVLAPGVLVFDAFSLPQNLRERPISPHEKEDEQWLTRGNSVDRQPVYSPDGEWIAFSSSRSGGIDIWQVSRKSGAVRRLTQDPAHEWDPGLTPDGKTLLFSSNRGGHFEIWAAESDGRRARQLTHDGYNAENPVATPDGRWIVYSSGNPRKRGLWKVRPDGSGAVHLVAGPTFHPEVSADGRYVLYHTPPDPGWSEIRVVRTEDGQPVDFRIRLGFTGAQAPASLARSAGSLGRARWMPDGRAIAFVGVDARSRTGILIQDFAPGRDTTASRRTLAGFDDEMNAESLGISPDGTRLVVSGVAVSSGLMVAEGFEEVSPKRRPVTSR